MRKQISRLKKSIKNNNGAALVTVIIAVAFIMVLVSIIMTTSLVNYKMKRTNVYAKDTFYSAEQVLDEINIGLQRYMSDALSGAYMDVMENFTDLDSEKKNTMMKTKYYERMWGYLASDTAHKHYSTSTLYNMLKTTTQWQGDETTGYGTVLKAVSSDGSTLSDEGNMFTYDEQGVILKNLRVYYKDSKGFVSIIQTDIRLSYPEFDFASNTVLPDIPDYILIADNGIECAATSGTVAMDGDVYADSIKTNGANKATPFVLEHKGNGELIVKHDLDLKGTRFSNEDKSTLWAENIIANSSDITIKGLNTNVANDLNIKGKNSNISLSGLYNGYGNSSTDANESSAILVNGVDSTLDLSKLKRITLAGHAYIGTAPDTTTPGTGGEGSEGSGSGSGTVNPSDTTKDIYTGESISVKSNQLMYLVPPECIGVSTVTNESKFVKNPITSDEYTLIQEGVNNGTMVEVSDEVMVSKLGTNISSYIKKDALNKPMVEKKFVRTSDPNKSLIYYYMTFPNEATANLYFQVYYNSNKASIDKYMSFYAKEIKFPSNNSSLAVRLAGNAIMTDENKDYVAVPYSLADGSASMNQSREQYSNQFTALCTKLLHSYTELVNLNKAPSDTEGVVYENLVDSTKLAEFINNAPGHVGDSVILDSGSTYGKAVVSNGNYTINDTAIHLVIAEGDVNVNTSNFSGTIICNGKINVAGSCNMKVEPQAVKALMRLYITYDDKNVMIAHVLRDGEDFSFISSGDDGSEKADSLADMIIYENWKKE